MTFTERQEELIEYLKGVGYGWGKFAQSVERQGRCSPKQEQTMERMKKRIRSHRPRHPQRGMYAHVGDIADLHDFGFGGHPGEFDGELA